MNSMNKTNKIYEHLQNFSDLINTPIIISNSSRPSEILHINKTGIELIEEVFGSTADFTAQVASFSGFFRKIIHLNKLDSAYTHALKKKRDLEDIFVSFTSDKNNLYSMLLKISILTDDEQENEYVITVINNMSEVFNYRTELHYSRQYLEEFIEVFARDRIVYLLAYEYEETVKHLMEVREFSKLIAYRIMMDSSIHNKQILEYSKITPLYIKILEIAALMHDFGKIHYDIKPLIQLPRDLTPDEYQTVKKHTVFGAEFIGNSNEILRMCWLVAKFHHEKWDGSGYPDGLKGNEIPLSARVVAFADMFSALRGERSYKKAITDINEIRNIFYQCESWFDPVIFKIGIRLLPEMHERTSRIKAQYENLKITSDTFIQFLRGIVNS